ncbi:MAG: NAD-dependent succinate-semialdehyde dehydrogenase [Acidobacteriota bacterium]
MKLVSRNPFTEEVNGEFDPLGSEECKKAVRRAREAFPQWRATPVAERMELIGGVGADLRLNRKRYAEIIAREMGKPIRQALSEIDKCASLCDYYSVHAGEYLEPERVVTEALRSYVAFDPLGVILGVMPWNFPFWQVFRFAIPALAAGNACLLKHASNVPLTALEIERVLRTAGFPEGIFQTLLIGSREVGDLIDLVDGVSLTGSLGAGSDIGARAGKGIKKLVLELGGSDPFIVLNDADLDRAADAAVMARTMNGGQSCIAAKRLIVMESVAGELVDRVVARLKKLRIGDPMDEATDMGPLAKREFLDGLNEQLEDALRRGATVINGPRPPMGKGFFFQPVVLTGVKPEMLVLKEEVFGPILPVITARDDNEIVRIANSTEFGLGAAIWSSDLERAESLASRLDAGFIAINDIVKSDPRLPFGGVKKSGVGRELSHFGLREFVNVRTVVVNG